LALLLEASDLEAALPYSRAVQVLYSAFRAFAEGTYRFPQRLVLDGSHGLLVAMPALDESSMAVKVATVHPGNPDLGLPSVQATVLLMDARTGELQGILDGTVLTLIRTAATSAVATDVLANPGPADLSVLGSGPLALAHIRALAEVRPLRSVRIYSPRLFARWATIATTLEPLGVDFGAMGSPESAVEGASIVVLATSAREPVLRWEWVSPGAHINAVGSHIVAGGQNAVMSRAMIIASRYGISGLKSSFIRVFATLHATKSAMPTGGVHWPIPSAHTTIVPK